MNENQLKRLDFNKQEFTANGTVYRIETSFSIERYCEYQKLEKELAFGTSFSGMYVNLKKMYDLLNSTKFVETSVVLNNLMNGMSKIEEREPTMLKLCALFINTENEDRTVVNNDVMEKKIADWKAEGIDVRDFFSLALNTMDGFIAAYKSLTQSILEIEGQSEPLPEKS